MPAYKQLVLMSSFLLLFFVHLEVSKSGLQWVLLEGGEGVGEVICKASVMMLEKLMCI